jgi:hypothetical protein
MEPISAWCLSCLVPLLMQSSEIFIREETFSSRKPFYECLKELLQAINFMHEVSYAHLEVIQTLYLNLTRLVEVSCVCS